MISPPQFPEGVPAGIILTCLVAIMVATTAGVFALFLLKRWRQMNSMRRQYTLFWALMCLLWVGISIRYLMVVGGFTSPKIYWINEVILQTTLFASGIPLMRYLSYLVFRSTVVSLAFTFYGSFGFLLSAWFLAQPDGILPGMVTLFTVEPAINDTSGLLFIILAGSSLVLLIIHTAIQLTQWYRQRVGEFPYDTLFSICLIIYIVLGTIDQLNAITGWTVVVFRILYVGVFLIGYLITSEDERRHEQYLVTSGQV